VIGGIIVKKLTCIICPRGCELLIKASEEGYEIEGNQCPKGKEYALSEMINPKRSLTSTVKTIYRKIPRLPVRTDREVELREVFQIMKELSKVEISTPLHSGEVVVYNILNTGANIITTSDMYELLEGARQ
jgi:CxxC motif-containing protein